LPITVRPSAHCVDGSTLTHWLAYIESIHPKEIEMGLDRIKAVWHRLAIPIQSVIITVGGTNGKGSTCAMLEQIYLEAGYRVGCYTSPHFLSYLERIRIDGQMVDERSLTEAFAQIEAIRGTTELTYFEFGTLAAMICFSMAHLDLIILEVGLGGRLDAVNIFDSDCAIVTSIDLDHMDYLGETREEIAFEKSGIFRQNTPAICGDIHPPKSLVDYANTIQANLKLRGKDFKAIVDGDGWRYVSQEKMIDHLAPPALAGDFQIENAACVIQAIGQLEHRLNVPEIAIRQGLSKVRLLGRFQYLSHHPDIILDVAHNTHAAKSLANNLKKDPGTGQTMAVISILKDKDIDGVIEALAPVIHVWYVSGIDHPRGMDAKEMERYIKKHVASASVRSFPSISEAFNHACKEANESDRIAVMGSFFTVAAVMRTFSNHSIQGQG
jgi:dihydrofolate synthase / folylpolyglutamate synthase